MKGAAHNNPEGRSFYRIRAIIEACRCSQPRISAHRTNKHYHPPQLRQCQQGIVSGICGRTTRSIVSSATRLSGFSAGLKASGASSLASTCFESALFTSYGGMHLTCGTAVRSHGTACAARGCRSRARAGCTWAVQGALCRAKAQAGGFPCFRKQGPSIATGLRVVFSAPATSGCTLIEVESSANSSTRTLRLCSSGRRSNTQSSPPFFNHQLLRV